LQLTAHFLLRWVLSPYGKEIPYARLRLSDLATASAGPREYVSNE
jgi:hypothetical protein